jgi:formate hydrogenlyase subunit 3/multisubunit Na+/H+ antiporter MnhD subunit
MHDLLYPIVILGAAGIIPIFIPRGGKILAGLVSLAASVWALLHVIKLFGAGEMTYTAPLFSIAGGLNFELVLRLYHFSGFVMLFTMVFGILVILYSIGYLRGKDTASIYYTFVLWTLASAIGAVLTDNLLVLLIFWEMLTFILYFLVNMGGEGHEKAAAKVFTVLGFSDAAMMLGVLMVWLQFNTLSMSALSISTATPFGMTAFILFFVGAIAKAGAMPFHSWVPAMAVPSLAPVMALLPASLDKLLGIYLLARISLDVFVIETGSPLSLMMMIVGSVTIVFAVLMALVQHDLKKLLSFHAVSQVGYMVLGVGSGIPIAIIGGLFHMLNNAIYKNGLFLAAGAMEKRAGTTNLEELGGLARLMPVTFVTTVVTALSISGVPPFNGFVSKWLVYQGMLSGGYVIFLVAAIFGSALTLASFVKVLHSLFLGRRPAKLEGVKEVDFTMQVPMILLAILCLAFGIYARYPLHEYIIPIIGDGAVSLSAGDIITTEGLWSPTTATILIVVGIVVGLIIYAFSRMRNVRVDENVWIGGNIMDNEEIRIPGTHFYRTVTDEVSPVLSTAFRDGDRGALDIYNLGGHLGGGLVSLLKSLHNGILSTYLSWIVIGLGVLAFILMFM